MSEHVSAESAGGVLTLTLDRPERRNAITVAMYAALADAFEAAADDRDIRVIAIRGEGADFSAGNDLADFLQALPRGGEEIPVWRLLRALARCTTPIVAAAHGNCIGIGTTLLLHCDLVVAAEGARFALPFVDLGLVPEAASSLIRPRLAGRRRAARYLLLAEPFGVDEAMEMGLVSHRAAPGDLRAEQDRIVAALLAKPPEALRQTQALLRAQGGGVMERMQEESARFAERLQSDEVKQAIAAFFAARSKAD
jgi:enoyl-CoA hydratase/carnithine racemase